MAERKPARNGRVSSAFTEAFDEHVRVFEQVSELEPVVAEIASKMLAVLLGGGKVLWCGNGGSAADAQHLAAELVGRFQRERRGLASVALTTDSSILTSIANDYGFTAIFRRQVQALGRAADMLVGISTSGNSENVCAALEEARSLGLSTVAMTGGTGGRMATLADTVLCVPSATTARVQEAHIFCGHVLCDLVESAMHQVERDALEPAALDLAGILAAQPMDAEPITDEMITAPRGGR